MKATVIHKQLIESHLKFSNYIAKLTQEDYNYSFNNKWNAGQHLDHITKSVAILKMAFLYPKWFVKYKFGKANRPSRTATEVIEKYLLKLKTAKQTPSRFQPKIINFKAKETALIKLEKEVKKLIQKSKKYNETNLDLYILPHPLLGKLTIREMLYFTDYHVLHHLELIQNAHKNKIN